MSFKYEAGEKIVRIGNKFVEGVGVSVAAEVAVKILEKILKSSL